MKKHIFLLLSSLIFAKETFYIQTIKIQPKSLQESRQYYGNFIEVDSLVKIINARTDGFVEKLFIQDQYSLIKKGEKLFSLYSPELFQVQNEYINALTFRSNIAKTQEKLLLLGVNKSLLQRIKKTKKPIISVPFSSPYEGIVFQKNIIEGQYIKKGEVLYKIIDISSLWFIAKVPQSDYVFLQSIKNATIQVDGFKNTFEAKFAKLLPNVNPQIKFIEVRFEIKNKDLKLYPNMFGIISIWQAKRKLLFAPKDSVLMRDGKTYVFLKSDDGFEALEIEARKLENGDYEILSGLEAGSEIAKNALFILDADVQNNGGY